jgi:hypothetical protein
MESKGPRTTYEYTNLLEEFIRLIPDRYEEYLVSVKGKKP